MFNDHYYFNKHTPSALSLFLQFSFLFCPGPSVQSSSVRCTPVSPWGGLTHSHNPLQLPNLTAPLTHRSSQLLLEPSHIFLTCRQILLPGYAPRTLNSIINITNNNKQLTVLRTFHWKVRFMKGCVNIISTL